MWKKSVIFVYTIFAFCYCVFIAYRFLAFNTSFSVFLTQIAWAILSFFWYYQLLMKSYVKFQTQCRIDSYTSWEYFEQVLLQNISLYIFIYLFCNRASIVDITSSSLSCFKNNLYWFVFLAVLLFYYYILLFL